MSITWRRVFLARDDVTILPGVRPCGVWQTVSLERSIGTRLPRRTRTTGRERARPARVSARTWGGRVAGWRHLAGPLLCFRRNAGATSSHVDRVVTAR